MPLATAVAHKGPAQHGQHGSEVSRHETRTPRLPQTAQSGTTPENKETAAGLQRNATLLLDKRQKQGRR